MDKETKTHKPKGSGSIYFDDKKQKWYAEIQWSDKNGEKRRKKFSSSKKIVVKNKLEDFKRQLVITNGDISSNDVAFKEFANYWLTEILVNKLKPTSYTRKEVTLENQVYPFIGNIPIKQLTHFDVQNMINLLNKTGLSFSTIKKAYEAVNGCLRAYRIKTGTSFNPCEGITLPINEKKDISNFTFFNEEQRSLIINESTRTYKNGKPVYRLGVSIILLMYTGMRIGELLALTWDDVDFDEKTININKNAVIVKGNINDSSHYKLINQKSTKTKSSNRIIPLSLMALNALRELYRINGSHKFVMATKSGKQNTPRNINRLFHSVLKQTRIAKSLDEMCGVHTLRHTFASMLFLNGCSVKVVSDILGHSDTKITENIYIHIIQKQKVKAIQDIDKYSG